MSKIPLPPHISLGLALAVIRWGAENDSNYVAKTYDLPWELVGDAILSREFTREIHLEIVRQVRAAETGSASSPHNLSDAASYVPARYTSGHSEDRQS